MFGHDKKKSGSDISPPFQELREKHLGWLDEADSNTLLHLAAWHGDLNLVRSFFESVRGRKLVTATNKKNATPLALALINGQVPPKNRISIRLSLSVFPKLSLDWIKKINISVTVTLVFK